MVSKSAGSAVSRRNLLRPKVVRENFGHINFSKALAPCSVLIATRGGENYGKFVAFAVCCALKKMSLLC